jgi:soluble lytic murein transglycosylase-like protein
LTGLVSASALRDGPSVAQAPAPVAASVAAPLGSPHPAPADPAALFEPDIERVAGAVARRYRIAEDATRALVGTAYSEGRRIGLDPLLIVAVIAVESRFNPIARSEGGALGLMQVIPRYHSAQFDAGGAASVLEPRTNIELGARVLKDYIRRGGTEVAGLQLYNGAAGDPSNGYANKVLVERQRLLDALRRSRPSNRA